MVHYPAESSHQRMGTWWPERDRHGWKQCSGRPWHLNNAQLALRCLKCAKKHPPHNYTTTCTCTVVTRHDGSMFSFCLRQILTLLSVSTEIETHQTRQHFSSLQLSNFGELLQIYCSLFFLLVVEMSGTRWGLLLL